MIHTFVFNKFGITRLGNGILHLVIAAFYKFAFLQILFCFKKYSFMKCANSRPSRMFIPYNESKDHNLVMLIYIDMIFNLYSYLSFIWNLSCSQVLTSSSSLGMLFISILFRWMCTCLVWPWRKSVNDNAYHRYTHLMPN